MLATECFHGAHSDCQGHTPLFLQSWPDGWLTMCTMGGFVGKSEIRNFGRKSVLTRKIDEFDLQLKSPYLFLHPNCLRMSCGVKGGQEGAFGEKKPATRQDRRKCEPKAGCSEPAPQIIFLSKFNLRVPIRTLRPK